MDETGNALGRTEIEASLAMAEQSIVPLGRTSLANGKAKTVGRITASKEAIGDEVTAEIVETAAATTLAYERTEAKLANELENTEVVHAAAKEMEETNDITT